VLHTRELMSGKLTGRMKVIHPRLSHSVLLKGGPKRRFIVDFE